MIYLRRRGEQGNLKVVGYDFLMGTESILHSISDKLER